jgi:nitroimidazol reductase NimA-like FMN-containing flavoprotein (pyridoxamine 5'-phosphate oxidase superfamily)
MTRMTTEAPASSLEEMSAEDCHTYLGLGTVGRLAMIIDDYPLVVPMNYRMLTDAAGTGILFRTGPGSSADRAPERVAFEVDGIDHYHRQGWSVVVRGDLHHLDQAEIELMSEDFDPGPWPREKTTWLILRPKSVTGRRLRAAEPEWTLHPDGYL